MAKGQKKSNRETKKPKKAPEKSVSAAGTGAAGLTGKIAGSSSYKDRYRKK